MVQQGTASLTVSQHSLTVVRALVSPLGGGSAGPIADPRRRRNSPAAYNADGRPLLGVVGHRYHHRPVVRSHVSSQLVSVGKPGGRAAPGNAKMFD